MGRRAVTHICYGEPAGIFPHLWVDMSSCRLHGVTQNSQLLEYIVAGSHKVNSFDYDRRLCNT